MFHLIWIFRFAVVKFLDGKKLAIGGMVLSAKKSLRFVNAALSWSFMVLAKILCRQYFGLNDDLNEISDCIGKDDYIKSCFAAF